MKVRLIPIAVLGAMIATACSNEEVVDVNPDVKGDAITFSPTVGRATRATETTKSNLGNFAVYAKAVHPNHSLYNSFLIGSETTPETAKEQDEVWTLDRNVYWPTGVERVFFWAYSPATLTSKFESTGPLISSFTPSNSDLASNNESLTLWTDGEHQTDLVVAFEDVPSSSNTSVTINFKHALSQVLINAQQKDKQAKDNRTVKIKGSWIVNLNGKGDLSAGFTWNKNDDKANHNTNWQSLSNPTSKYGSYFTSYKNLSGGKQDVLDESLMIIPQHRPAWNRAITTTPEAENTLTPTNDGVYIMLLCRIELRHPGTTHEGDEGDLGDVAIEGSDHLHQLFPVTDKFNSNEYGFACIPVDIDFAMGKKYTIDLDICGKDSGAGYYPPVPENESDLKNFLDKFIPKNKQDNIITKRPDNKKVGDPILDDPIKFNVTVDAWENDDNWKPGNITM